ncbi:MAG: hypothetical protein H7293_20035 [Candidatus Saccharibacteria bacterium]|nr:hypothetical protein [Rhodoferax sp.]
MIIFNNIRTKRLAVRLREISIQQAVAVCRLPADRHEATTTEFLRFVAAGAECPTPAYVTDPRLMTVEERTLLVCHYLSQVSPGGPDFSVGDTSKFSDYVSFADDIGVLSVDMGEVAGERRTLYPLLGIHAELLERLCVSRGDWLIGMMACQIHTHGQQQPDYAQMTDTALLEWCSERIKAMRDMAESDMEELYLQYETCNKELRHFFITGADDGGLVFWPQAEAEGAGQSNPARFRALSCVSEFTKRIFYGFDQSGR